MSRSACPAARTAQTTCRVRSSSTAIDPFSLALEITHACRLRRKLKEAGAGEILVSVWGVGLRLSAVPLGACA
jgi:DNA-binding response OmpR family regulator